MKLEYPISPNLITHVTFAHDAISAKLRADCGLDINRYRIMSYLVGNGGQASQRGFVARLETTPKSVTVAVGNLEKAELIERVGDGGDQRAKSIKLSETGIEALRAADYVIEEVVAALWLSLRTEKRKYIVQSVLEGERFQSEDEGDGKVIRAIAAYVNDIDRVNKRLKKELKAHGLSLDEFRVLQLLYCLSCGMRMGMICAQLLIYPNKATSVLANLEERGFAERFPDHLDGRAVCARITVQGANRLKDPLEAVDAMFCSGVYPTSLNKRSELLRIADIISAQLQEIYSFQFPLGVDQVSPIAIVQTLLDGGNPKRPALFLL